MNTSQLTYIYTNKSNQPVDIWLSAAPGTTDISFNEVQPSQQHDHPFLGSMYYFKLHGKQSLHYQATYQPHLLKHITEEEKEYFLRSSELIPITLETRKKVFKLTNEFEDVEDKARAIFDYVKDTFTYSSSIKKRGFDVTMSIKKGDCGELSAIIATFCRCINIPCRVMVGAFKGSSQLHAWNEIYIEKKGWIPVDVSVAMYTFARHPIRNIGSIVRWGAFSNRKRYFGEIEDGRIVFSIDPERELTPVYEDIVPSSEDMAAQVGKSTLHWGHESINGCAPYMQPIYPRLNSSFTSIKAKDVLGKAKVKKTNALDHYSSLVKVSSFSLAAVLIYISIMLNVFNVELSNEVARAHEASTVMLLGTFSLLTFIRREFNLPILILCVLFFFSSLSFILSFI